MPEYAPRDLPRGSRLGRSRVPQGSGHGPYAHAVAETTGSAAVSGQAAGWGVPGHPDLSSTPATGLTDAEAERRRAAGLGNAAPPPTTRTYAAILRENVFTFVNNVLFLLGLALALVGRPTDALVSLAVISTNIIVGIVQEIRAKRTLDRIALLTRPTADGRPGRRRSASSRRTTSCSATWSCWMPATRWCWTGDWRRARPVSTNPSSPANRTSSASGPATRCSAAASRRRARAGTWPRRSPQASFANQITAGARSFRRVLTPLQAEVNLVVRVVLGIVIYLEILLVMRRLQRATAVRGRRRPGDAAGGPGAQRPVPLDRRGLRAGRGADHPLGRAGAAVERHRVAQPRGRPVPRQDRAP